jgi:hypothetical protein
MKRRVMHAHDRTKIIELNDQLRSTFIGGRVQMTPAVWALDTHLRHRALAALSAYKTFADDTEHNQGVLIIENRSFEWCIEYRGKDGTGFSTNPADPEKTLRVLTLYAASDVRICVPAIYVTGIVVELGDKASSRPLSTKFPVAHMLWKYFTLRGLWG